MHKLFSVVLLLALITGCSSYQFPGVHRITIQQGNVVTQTMIDKLKPGMTRRQVQFVLGNPIIDDQLNADRWDYVYTIDIPGIDNIHRTLQIYFVEERLSYFEGDYAPSGSVAATSEATSPN